MSTRRDFRWWFVNYKEDSGYMVQHFPDVMKELYLRVDKKPIYGLAEEKVNLLFVTNITAQFVFLTIIVFGCLWVQATQQKIGNLMQDTHTYLCKTEHLNTRAILRRISNLTAT